MRTIKVYTDGSCSGNPGPGAFCAIILDGEKEKTLSSAFPETTNNRMELLSMIVALRELKTDLKDGVKVEIYSDSAYVINALTQGWLTSWQKNGWRSANKSPVKNQDLWLEMAELIKLGDISFFKVKGHADDKYNNMCDEVAQNLTQQMVQEQAKKS